MKKSCIAVSRFWRFVGFSADTRRCQPTALFLALLLLWKLGFCPSVCSGVNVASLQELQNMTNDLSAHYSLAASIDASDTTNWNNNAGFVPVGKDAANRQFSGTFDGNGHIISNLYINRPNENDVGLFGYTYQACFSNVTLVGAYVRGSNDVGILVGDRHCGGTILNSRVSGTVVGYATVGGLVGRSHYGEVVHCSGKTVATGQRQIGGLVGYDFEGAIVQCHSDSIVTGREYHAGGLLGYSFLSRIEECYSEGNVSGSDWHTGGLLGGTSSLITNCYSRVRVIGTNCVGGLMGILEGGNVVNSYSVGLVSGISEIGGLVGRLANSGVSTNAFWDTETSGISTSATGTGRTTLQMKQKATYTNSPPPWDFVDIWRIVEGETYPYLPWDAGAHDSDRDGMSDWWEEQYFSDPTNCPVAGDYDGDGQSNLQEFTAGTNPKDTNSVFRLQQSPEIVDGKFVMSWDTLQDRLYTVYSTTNLLIPDWTNDYQVCGDGGWNSYTNSDLQTGPKFHRLGVRLRYFP